MDDFPLTQEIIDAIVAAKNNNPNALLMCDTVAKKFTSTQINGNPIWTLPQEQKYLDLPNDQRLYYCKSGQFVEDIKYTGKGSIDQLLDSLKSGIDSVSDSAKDVKKETRRGFDKLAGIAIIGVIVGVAIKLIK